MSHLVPLVALQLVWPWLPVPICIPAANLLAEQTAQALGGIAQTALPEVLLDVLLTAHCMGGVVMMATPQEGVCDAQQRVFG